MECVFCKIASNAAPSYVVYEDDSVMAFLEIRPVSEGHVLVIPKKHVGTVYELDSDSYTKLMLVVKNLGNVIQEAFSPKRVGMLVYGFDVEHAHIHLIPLYNGNETIMHHGETPNEEEMKRVVACIANAL